MAYITGSVSDIIGTLPFSLAANSQLTMSIQNNGDAPSYWGLETIPDNNGFYTLTTPKNLSGSFISGSGISNVVYDDYKMSAVVNPGGGTLVFNNAVAISASTLWTRATAPSPLPGDFPYALANGYSARVSRLNGVTEASSAIVSSIQTQPLLQNASFLYIPSGYASGSAFSQLSTNDYGDLTWSRASDGTRTNSEGLVQRVPWNLVQYSEDFSNASWTKSATTLTANTTVAPNNTTTADTLIENTANTTHQIFQSITNVNGVTPYTAMIYVKENASRNVAIRIQDGAFTYGQVVVTYNLNTGALISQVVTGNAVIVSTSATLTNGYYLITVSFSLNLSTSFRYDVLMVNGTSNSYTGDGTSSIIIWGAQLVEGTSPQSYLPTTTRLNVPRLDYTYGSDPALLLEPQRTNSIRNSTMMSASVAGNILPSRWVFTSNGMTSSVVGLGYENNLPYIDLRTFGTASNTFTQYILGNDADTPTTSGSRQTFSTWVKVISSSLPPISTRLLVNEISSSNAYIRSNTLNINPTSTLQRFILTASISDPSASFATPCVFFSITNGQRYDFTTRIAAPQLESGSFATTWIPTYLSSATRIADSFSRNNIYTNGLITSSGGTWFVELRGNIVYTRDTAGYGLAISDQSNPSIGAGASGNTFAIIRTSTSSVRLQVVKQESLTLTALYTTTTDTTKIAIKWNGSTADIFANGTKVVSATAFTATSLQHLIGLATDVPKYIQQMALYNQPLAGVDMGVLTGASYYPSFLNMAQALNYTIA